MYKCSMHRDKRCDINTSHWKASAYNSKEPFKYYAIKEVGGWGQKMAIFDDLQYCKISKRWVGGPKKVKNVMT